MTIPKAAHTPRPVQVQWLQTSVLVEHDPRGKASPRSLRARDRIEKAKARGDMAALNVARADFLAENLCGWSLTPGKPTREALSRMPAGWLAAALVALGEDAAEYLKETEGDVS